MIQYKRKAAILSSISVVLPAYNDSKSIPIIIKKLIILLPTLANDFEIIVINDASVDDTRIVLEELQKKIRYLFVVNHPTNQGYGATISDGFNHATKEYIFYTDGDGQYDVDELPKLVELMDDKTDLVTGYKINRSDSIARKILGAIHNQIMRRIFLIPIKDLDCDFRLFRKSILDGIDLKISSGAFDVEFISKLARKNIRIKEVGVSHYPRLYGKSQIFTVSRIAKSLFDIAKVKLYEYTKK